MESKSCYCIEDCPIGRKAKDHFLEINESVVDAVVDFNDWLEKCKEDCDKYKIKKELSKEQ